ncbi:MAG: Do family serine endopeptidase [Pseudomonadota bacterium]
MNQRTPMNTRFAIATIFALLMPASAAQAALPAQVDGQPLPSLAPLVKEVSPAVVNIQVVSTVQQRGARDPFREFFGTPRNSTPREMRSAGSGVIVDAANGYILTNHHVVENATSIRVTLFDDRVLEATVVGSDQGTDVAVLQVDEDNLVDIRLGDSENIEVGDFVIAIGNPFGLTHTVTSGIVSALGRSGISRSRDRGYEDFIQTDASINPGNSGGALVNLAGELVGINSAIISGNGGNVGIGFAIPSNMAQSIMRQLLDFGEIRRGLLGVSITTLDAEAAEAIGVKNIRGAMVAAVNAGSAAEQAGIEVNDIITAVNGEKVDSDTELRNAIGLLRGGDRVEITALRDGDVRTFVATLDELGATSAALVEDIHPNLRGATLTDNAQDNAVEVTEVEPNSPAAARGLRAGDRIITVNREPVNSLEDLENTSRTNSTRAMFIEVERNGRRLLLRF